mgnify:FL=1
MTNKQSEEIECLKYFMHDFYKTTPITSDDEKAYSEFSTHGKKPGEETQGFKALVDAKTWREVHVAMYERDILKINMPLYAILGLMDRDPVPKPVVKFLKRSLFSGTRSELIETVYAEACSKRN